MVLKPGLCLEPEIIESDAAISITADQVPVIHGEQNIDRRVLRIVRFYIELDDLLEPLFADLADSCLDFRHLPDEDLA